MVVARQVNVPLRFFKKIHKKTYIFFTGSQQQISKNLITIDTPTACNIVIHVSRPLKGPLLGGRYAKRYEAQHNKRHLRTKHKSTTLNFTILSRHGPSNSTSHIVGTKNMNDLKCGLPYLLIGDLCTFGNDGNKKKRQW